MTQRRVIDPAELRRLAAEGMCCAECARHLGFSWDAVARAAGRHGIDLPAGRSTPHRRAAAAALIRKRWADPIAAAALSAGREKAVWHAAAAKAKRKAKRMAKRLPKHSAAEADRMFGAALAAAYGRRA